MPQPQNHTTLHPPSPVVEILREGAFKGDTFRYFEENVSQLFADQSLRQEEKKVVLQGIDSSLFLPIMRLAWHYGWTVAVIRQDVSRQHLRYFLSQLKPSLLISAANDTSPAAIPSDWPPIFPDERLQRNRGETPPPYPWQEDQCAAILFTSGSTGAPKGVCHSYGNMLRSAGLFVRHFNLRSRDHLYCLAPPHSMSGFRSLILPLVTPARVTMHQSINKTFLAIIHEIGDYRPTKILCGPVFVHQLAAYGKRLVAHLHGVDALLCTGADLNKKDQAAVEDIFHIPVLNYYGLTETAGIVLAEKPDRRAHGDLPPPCADVRIVLKPVERSANSFQLHISSDNIFLGYLGDPLFRRRSFDTGDLVARTSGREFKLIGRATGAVKAPSTEWLFPNLLENWLREQNCFADVVVKGVEIPGGYALEVWMDSNGAGNFHEIDEAINDRFGPEYRPVTWHESTIVRNQLGKVEHCLKKSTGNPS